MRKFCPQVVIENFFEPCILYLLLKKPSYGYEISKNLLRHCECQVNVGNLYKGLNRLVTQGYATKQTVDSSLGPTRVVYEITDSGKEYLKGWIDNLKKQQKTISKLIINYQQIT
ncbi:PadR family transcriptional regulator [Candidatus Roizmanbacteria bacterium]|nr:PadR family transcriptional regulator [Candidatus Roizmanbacteria bacterium]